MSSDRSGVLPALDGVVGRIDELIEALDRAVDEAMDDLGRSVREYADQYGDPDRDWELLAEVSADLSAKLSRMRFGPPVTHVYDPLVYAREPWEDYLRRYGNGRGRVVLLGMNPGPWGMAQTGVPFGDPAMVRGWLGIRGQVAKPELEHPKRPVLGLDSPRGEVSGRRVWGWARDRFGTPEAFFERFFVANYCPLCFMEESGRNRTPDKLRVGERRPLLELCDAALVVTMGVLEPRAIMGMGKFATERARVVGRVLGVPVVSVPHPSPANPKANRGWAELMDRAVATMGDQAP